VPDASRAVSGARCRTWGLALAGLTSLTASASAAEEPGPGDWPAYGRTHLGDRHSPLDQITPENVGRLAVAWRYSTGEAETETREHPRLSATPIVAEGAMYLVTPLGKVAALDPTTGVELWSHDFAVDRDGTFPDFTSRGVSVWRDAAARPDASCATRVLVGVVDARLAALDAATGTLCADFGAGGVVDRTGPDPDWDAFEYELTSPPAVIGDLVIVGSSVGDNSRVRSASGEVRAFHARTGALVWTWDPIPQDPDDPAYATWEGEDAHASGAANAWSVIAADPARGLVFVPTGSPSVDYWGGHRLGDNTYANSIVALRAATGAVVWHFQVVHHDLWDYDLAAPPALVTLSRDGRAQDVVLVATKTGQLFVLDRETGEPVFPVEERAVPASDVPGEQASPTQPFSAALPALSPQTLERAWGATPEIEAECQAWLDALRNDGAYTPPSREGSLVLPSNVGGVNWGGVAYDPERRLVVVAVNTIAAVITLTPRDSFRTDAAAMSGRIGGEATVMQGAPYALRRELFLTPAGALCSPPPHGALVAVDLAEGRLAWSVPLGTAEGLPLPGADALVGIINLGGAITTAGGLTFIGATPDRSLRAFDTATGEELWRGELPAGARATPMTYLGADGRQYVVVAAGGDGELWGRSDEFVAFALPRGPDPEASR
jgi:quinoprotein glucose dehydrogenase